MSAGVIFNFSQDGEFLAAALQKEKYVACESIWIRSRGLQNYMCA